MTCCGGAQVRPPPRWSKDTLRTRTGIRRRKAMFCSRQFCFGNGRVRMLTAVRRMPIRMAALSSSGRGRILGGGAGAEAALHFRLNVAAQVFRNDAGRGQFAEVENGELWQVGKNCRKRRGRLAKKSNSNVVGDGPLAMMNDGRNYSDGQFSSGESLQDLRLGEVGIVENHGEHLRMALREQGAGNARRASTRQRNFLAERDLPKAGEQLLLGVAFQLGGDGGRKRELHQIHQIKVTDQAESCEAR